MYEYDICLAFNLRSQWGTLVANPCHSQLESSPAVWVDNQNFYQVLLGMLEAVICLVRRDASQLIRSGPREPREPNAACDHNVEHNLFP
jgi:hypothetical protein